MQFCNELARILGTCQYTKGNSKAVSVSVVDTNSGKEVMPSKFQQKHEAKVSTQSSQIRDICSKLDSTITENS